MPKNYFLSILFAAMIVLLPSCKIYQSMGKSFGAFVSKPSGPEFTKISDVPEDRAVLYVYRPYSSWASYELEAPSFYFDDERLFGLKGDSYTYAYVIPGDYEIVMRRPLGGMEGIKTKQLEVNLSKIAAMDVRFEPGKIYFMRYSEVEEPDVAIDDISPEGNDPLLIVSEQTALKDILSTKLLPENGMTLAPKPELLELE